MLVSVEEQKLVFELIEALGAAAGDAGVMVHQHHDLRWRALSDALDLTKTSLANVAASFIIMQQPLVKA